MSQFESFIISKKFKQIPKTDERILDITDDYLFLDIGLDKNLTFISKEQSGVFSFQYGLTIEDRKSKFQHLYIIDKQDNQNKTDIQLISDKLSTFDIVATYLILLFVAFSC